jgi:HAD superfamily hydrolase (TIGR01549 family)
MEITTVLLDAGGVILDESEHEEKRAEIIVELLSAVIPEYSISMYHSDIEEAVKSYCPKTYQYVFWKHLKDDRYMFEKLHSIHLDRWQQRKSPLKLSSGLEDEVRTICKDFKIGIAGQYGREILSLLKRQSILDCFAYHLTQNDFSVTKPDPRYYEQIVQTFGIVPQQCIMVGDRIDNDIIPAKRLGMRTILIRTGLHRNQQPRIPFEVPDAELDGVLGLAAAVQKVAKRE